MDMVKKREAFTRKLELFHLDFIWKATCTSAHPGCAQECRILVCVLGVILRGLQHNKGTCIIQYVLTMLGSTYTCKYSFSSMNAIDSRQEPVFNRGQPAHQNHTHLMRHPQDCVRGENKLFPLSKSVCGLYDCI